MFRLVCFLLTAVLISACGKDVSKTNNCAPMAVFDYQDFGPQSMAFDFIGYEIWQWISQSAGDPKAIYPIKVVVYADGQADRTKIKFPVNELEEKDFRYVAYENALNYLDANLTELEVAKKEGFSFGDLTSTLQKTRTRITKEVCLQ